MKKLVRYATDNDVWQIQDQMNSMAHTEEWMFLWYTKVYNISQSQNFTWIVCGKEDNVSWFLSIDYEELLNIEISNLYVDKLSRGKWIAKAMIDWAIDDIKIRHPLTKYVNIRVYDDNTTMLTFLAKNYKYKYTWFYEDPVTNRILNNYHIILD